MPEAIRGTVAALAHPAVLDHLTRLGVDAVELMPVAAWIDERHLAAQGLRNAWGYNPVVFLAPEPRICPGGMAELAATVAALHDAGIGVILDVVYNHTGEGERAGSVLSLRGLDAQAYFRHHEGGHLVNDSGTGNTLDCEHPATRRLILDAMRHFVGQAGIDGFRFDLAPILGRDGRGFDPRGAAPARDRRRSLARLAHPDRRALGHRPRRLCARALPAPWLEWNDRFRDRVRTFWQGASERPRRLRHRPRRLGRRLSSATTPGRVNFVAAHDGFTLADLVSYDEKHNEANGEANRDGNGTNHSWNNGVEGPSDDPAIRAARARDVRALLASLFASRGSIMLTAGDEFGRSQHGNNNAYAQDNETTWLDWRGRDRDLEAFTAALAAFRRAHPALADPAAADRRSRAQRPSRRRLAYPGRHSQIRGRLGDRAFRRLRHGSRARRRRPPRRPLQPQPPARRLPPAARAPATSGRTRPRGRPRRRPASVAFVPEHPIGPTVAPPD